MTQGGQHHCFGTTRPPAWFRQENADKESGDTFIPLGHDTSSFMGLRPRGTDADRGASYLVQSR